MKALVFDGKLRLVNDYHRPNVSGGQAIVHVRHAGICATDLEIIRGYLDFRGVPGHEFVGIVTEGPNDLLGQRVVGEINCVCHQCDMCHAQREHHCRRRTVLGISGRDGAFAEFLTLPVENLHPLPDSLTDDQAVFVEPLAAAIRATQQYAFKPSDRVAVLGAGRLGLLVAQVVAPHVDELVLYSRSQAKGAVCKQLGFDLRLSDDVRRTATFHVVVDCTGQPAGFDAAQQLAMPEGTIILKSTYASNAGPNLAASVINELTIIGSRCGSFPDAINALADGTVNIAPMITARYPLDNGLTAFEQAQQPGNVKVIVDMPE